MNKEDIARINELAKKQRSESLNEEEKLEQANLRNQYIEEYRQSLRATLDSVMIKEKAAQAACRRIVHCYRIKAKP